MTKLQFRPIPADTAIDLYTGLVSARRLKLQPALNAAVKAVGVTAIDGELQRLVPAAALTHLATLGIRGERVFPVPSIIKHSPSLIGYYRMLLGLSQKEFAQPQRLGYGPWVSAEHAGRLGGHLEAALDQFCKAMAAPLVKLVAAMNEFDDRDLNDLSLLTLGPTLQGGRNNVIGSKAAEGVFHALRSIVSRMIIFDSARLVRFRTPAGREFELAAASEPDASLTEGSGADATPILAVEIKGGKDASNAHNRAGEAEKSHLKAKLQGYAHRWTIIHLANISRGVICSETPSSTEVFEASDILKMSGADWNRLRKQFKELISQ